jgi:hypothetical protein
MPPRGLGVELKPSDAWFTRTRPSWGRWGRFSSAEKISLGGASTPPRLAAVLRFKEIYGSVSRSEVAP